MRIARYTQIFCIADIRAELETVIASDLCNIVGKLILPFALGQRTVALVSAQRLS